MNKSLTLTVLLATVLYVSAVAGVSARTPWLMQATAPVAAETLNPDDTATRVTFEAVCGSCHGPAVATTTFRTRQEWAEMLDLMVSFGATATDAQFMQVQAYLARRYGKVNINRAPVDELQAVLGISTDLARAVVDSRSTMRLTSVDDLKNVPGITAMHLEQFKDHLQF